MSCDPFIAWPSNLDRKSRGQIKFARVLCYVPNLGLGKGSSSRETLLDKLNVEHACLRTVMSQLAVIQSAGGIRTVVMGKQVRVVPWLHIATGDIVGQNNMVGHYNAHGNTANPNRTCHYSHEEMDNPQPECQLVTVEEINIAYDNNDLEAFRAMAIHPIKSCFVGVPLSCQTHGMSELCLLAYFIPGAAE